MTSRRATKEQVQAFLSNHPSWDIDDGKLTRSFVFRNFSEAFGFMTEVALVAERSNHHPEWSNIYKTVSVHLTTHEFGGVSQRDFELAREMDEIAARRWQD